MDNVVCVTGAGAACKFYDPHDAVGEHRQCREHHRSVTPPVIDADLSVQRRVCLGNVRQEKSMVDERPERDGVCQCRYATHTEA
jgi:hypothetical protein